MSITVEQTTVGANELFAGAGTVVPGYAAEILSRPGDGEEWSEPYLQARLGNHAAGVPGAPFNFAIDTGDNPAATLWTELNRLRAALFAEATEANKLGWKEWALVSDPCLFSPSDPITNTDYPARALNAFEIQRNFEGQNPTGSHLKQFREVAYIVRESIPTTVRAYLKLTAEETTNNAALTFNRYTITGETGHGLLRARTAPRRPAGLLWSATNDDCDIAFHFFRQTADGTTPVFTLTGVHSALFTISRVVRFVIVQPQRIWHGFDVYVRANNEVTNLAFPIDLDIDCASSLSFTTKSRALNLHFGEEQSSANGLQVAVISSETSAWRVTGPMNTDGLGYTKTAGTNTYPGNQHRGSIWAELWSGDSGGVWRARTAPIGIPQTESIIGRHQLWRERYNAQRTNHVTGTGSSAYTDAIQWPSKRAQVRAPSLYAQEKWWTDSARDSNWPGWKRFEVTIPAALETASAFALPALRLSEGGQIVERFDANTTCEYYKIPLAASPELERIVRWFDGADGQSGSPLAAKDYTSRPMAADLFPLTSIIDPDEDERSNVAALGHDAAAHGTYASAHYHDARLTTADGSRFWWMDIVGAHPSDILGTVTRWRHWFVGPDGDGVALYLLVDKRSVAIGIDSFGNPITVQSSYFPEQNISRAQYRAQYGQLADEPVRNWTEFNAPFKILASDPATPVHLWTVGRKSAQWTPGQTLVLHLPQRVSRNELIDFQARPLIAVEGGRQSGFHPTRWSQLHDLCVVRQPHKRQVLALRNNSARLAYWPALDLRLYTVARTERFAGDSVPEQEHLRAREINPADYRVSSNGTITFRDTAPLAGEEWPVIVAAYQKRNVPPTALEVELGNADANGVFTEYKTATIGPDGNWGGLIGQFAGRVFETAEESQTLTDAKWIFHEIWALAFRKKRAAVGNTVRTEANAFGGVTGILAFITPTEDALLRYSATWESESGATVTTEHIQRIYPVESLIAPWLMYNGTRYWMTGFTVVTCEQEFDVRVSGRELCSNPVPQAKIIGTPLRFHFNETKRLLEARAANQN
jgi:hypothetical protein